MNNTKKKEASVIRKIMSKFFHFESSDENKVTFREGMKGLAYYYHNLRTWKPKLFLLGILRVFPDLLIPLFSMLLPTLVVKGLEDEWNAVKFLYVIGTLIFAFLICNLVNSRIQIVITEQKEAIKNRYTLMLFRKQMDIDYDILVSKTFVRLKHTAYHWIVAWGNGPIERCISSPGIIMSCLIGMIGYGILLVNLSPWILLFIIISVMISLFISGKALRSEDAMWGKNSADRRKLRYLRNRVMSFEEGKDIRLFGMRGWLLSLYKKSLVLLEKYYNEAQNKFFAESATDVVMAFVRDAIAYSYIIVKIVEGELGVTDAVLYTTLIAGFSNWFRKAVDEIQNLIRGGFAFFSVKKCFDTEGKWSTNESKKTTTARNKEGLLIELKDVSFSYPNSERPIISHMNLTIKPGEKLALVGLNGAGKTTFVMLLCGFCYPTEGEILVNGKKIHDYNIDEYYSLISAVFQDASILPLSIRENISCQDKSNTDEKRIAECLKLSGFEEKVGQLKKGEDTILVRELSEEAIELSGGEKQKLLLSRAIYKDSSFLILDEPTAALDPIAENEIYMKYSDLTKGKTSLFISHRLSSTRFCDRIILLEDGRIKEEGTHDSLIALGGRYAELYQLQSRYYMDNVKDMEGGEELYAE